MRFKIGKLVFSVQKINAMFFGVVLGGGNIKEFGLDIHFYKYAFYVGWE